MIVVVIIAVIMAFAVPLYSKSILKIKVKDAINQLVSLHAADDSYRSRHGKFWVPPQVGFSTQDVDEINAALGLKLMLGTGTIITYTATGGTGNVYTTDITLPEGASTVVVQTPLSPTNPQCSSGCP